MKALSTAVAYCLAAMVTNMCCHLKYDLREAWHEVYGMLLSNKK